MFLSNAMRQARRLWASALAAIVLSGCAPGVREEAPGKVEERLIPEFREKSSSQAVALPGALDPSLLSETIYSFLVAEIATQRGEWEAAYNHYLYAAGLSHEPYGAEQATQIGVYLKEPDKALAALEQWVELTPDALSPRLLGTQLALSMEQKELALEHMKALIEISLARGEDGFARAAAVVSQSTHSAQSYELMRKAVSEYTSDPRARYALAVVAIGANELEVAEAELRSLDETFPSWPKALILLSEVLNKEGKGEDARLNLEQALESDPENRALLTAYARLLMESGDQKGAFEQFLKIERLEPNDEDVLYALGILAMDLERWDQARSYLRKLFGMDKRKAESSYFLGYLYQQVGKESEEAVHWYEKVPEGEYYTDARIKMAILQGKSGKVEEARRILTELRGADPDRVVEIFQVEGEILRNLDRCGEAMDLYGLALETHRENHDLLYARALCAASLEQMDRVERDLRTILSTEPDHVDALNALGYTLADLTDRLEEALGYIEKALALRPDSPAILDSMGWVQYRMGNIEESLQYLRQAFELMPDPEIAAHLGEVLWLRGERAEAQKVWEEALARNPGSRPLQKVMERFQP